jgi:hypothetical protein
LEPVCFESAPSLGGIWQYTAAKDSHSSIYSSTVVNTSKEMMQFSDFPIPEDWPEFLHHSLVQKYLENYANHFDLRKYIKFGRRVASIRPLEGEEKWEIIYKRKEKKIAEKPLPSVVASASTTPPPELRLSFDRGVSIDFSPNSPEELSLLANKKSYEINFEDTISRPRFGTDVESILPPKPRSSYRKDNFDFVMVCSGHHWKARVPDFPGMDDFNGQMIHSSQYKL